MSRAKGIPKALRDLGNYSFSKREGYFIITEKMGVDAKRIATDPVFQAFRENSNEFRRVTAIAKMIRTPLISLTKIASDNYMVARFNGYIIKALQSDTKNPHGLRNIIDGDIKLLIGFDFNKAARLTAIFTAPFTTTLNRQTGHHLINIPAFIPSTMINAPKEATHFRINSCAAEINFVQRSFIVEINNTTIFNLDDTVIGPLELNIVLAPQNAHPLILLLGIEFLQPVKGSLKTLHKSKNALLLVAVN